MMKFFVTNVGPNRSPMLFHFLKGFGTSSNITYMWLLVFITEASSEQDLSYCTKQLLID